ncbi:hypothetical protein GCM10028895_38720 [Pontibacter rugosus]
MKNLNKFRSYFFAATVAISSFAFTNCDDDNDPEPEVIVEARGLYDQKGYLYLMKATMATLPVLSLSRAIAQTIKW